MKKWLLLLVVVFILSLGAGLTKYRNYDFYWHGIDGVSTFDANVMVYEDFCWFWHRRPEFG